MSTHVKVIAGLYIVFGVIGIMVAVGLGLIISFGGWVSGDQIAMTVTTIVAIVLGMGIFLFSVPGIIAGIGLFKFKEWARIFSIILGILNLPGFPIGTALGLYTLFIMLDAETVKLFVPPTSLPSPEPVLIEAAQE